MSGKRALLVLVLAVATAVAALVWPRGHDRPAAAPRLHLAAMPAPTDRDDDLLEWAELVLAGRCMAAAGYEFSVDWVVEHGKPDFVLMPYGTTDTALAERYGYGIGPALSGQLRGGHTDPNRAYVASLSRKEQQRYSVAFFGGGADPISVTGEDGSTTTTNRDGCLSGARQTLYGDLARWVALDVWASNLDEQLVPEVLADPAYRTALAAWRSCMAAAGHPAATPDDSRTAISELYRTAGHAAAWPVEQATAVADARCTAGTQLLAVAERLHGEHARRLFAGRAADVEEYQARRTEAVRRARDLLTELTR
ncbi:hypothetical protein [Dactylosporangium sp. CS-033363]|uniref:hypothetical protein n=1 Tax=Dactylosporangium sp. CS-033363 TaxID=3239935 RepID=UPI003D923BE7